MLFSSYCISCGIKISDLPTRQKYYNTLYCSTKCRSYKPQKVYKLEQKYGKDIKIILEELFNKHHSQMVADLCDITLETLWKWVKKYEPDLSNRKPRGATPKEKIRIIDLFTKRKAQIKHIASIIGKSDWYIKKVLRENNLYRKVVR